MSAFSGRIHDKKQKLFKSSFRGFITSFSRNGEMLFLERSVFIFYRHYIHATRNVRFPFHPRNAHVIYNVIYLIRINEGIINRVGTAPPLRLGMFADRSATCKSSQLGRLGNNGNACAIFRGNASGRIPRICDTERTSLILNAATLAFVTAHFVAEAGLKIVRY